MKLFSGIRNFFKRVNERHRRNEESRKMMRTLQGLAVVFESLDQFRKAGWLYYDFKNNVVTIADVLAEYFIEDDASWQHFLSQVHRWAVHQYSVNEYLRMFRECQANAEAKAYAKNKNITDAERRIVKMNAVSKFDAEHGTKPLQIPDIMFVVIGATEDGKPLLVAKLVDGKYEIVS